MYELCVFDDRRVSVQQKMQVKKEKKKKRVRERERESGEERKKNIVEHKKRTRRKKNVSGRKYLADQLDYSYCCSIRDHLNANLSRNTSESMS
jgi:hypothetical protein